MTNNRSTTLPERLSSYRVREQYSRERKEAIWATIELLQSQHANAHSFAAYIRSLFGALAYQLDSFSTFKALSDLDNRALDVSILSVKQLSAYFSVGTADILSRNLKYTTWRMLDIAHQAHRADEGLDFDARIFRSFKRNKIEDRSLLAKFENTSVLMRPTSNAGNARQCFIRIESIVDKCHLSATLWTPNKSDMSNLEFAHAVEDQLHYKMLRWVGFVCFTGTYAPKKDTFLFQDGVNITGIFREYHSRAPGVLDICPNYEQQTETAVGKYVFTSPYDDTEFCLSKSGVM